MLYRLYAMTLFIFTTNTLAADIVVYRWVDDKNIVHFSQHQPKHDNYTELTMSEAFKASAKKNDRTRIEKELEDSLSVQNINDDLASNEESLLDDVKDKCAAAKLNLKTLNTFDKIQYTDENGEVKVLSNTQKNKQQALSEKQIEVYCNAQ